MRFPTALITCLVITAIVTATAAAGAAGPSVVAGGCRVQADVTVTPGLTLASRPFQYSYRGGLSLCVYTGTGAAKGGTITAGEPITIHGHTYQEPRPTGSGTCLSTVAQGYDFAHWKNGTQTIVKFATTSASGETHLTGSVIPSLQLPAVHPSAGAPASTTFKTTRFVGQEVVGLLVFHASNPALCSKPQGLSRATITGVLGHVGLNGA
jgi:hypothetical protein